MPREKRSGSWKALNLQISEDLYNQLKERAEIKGQTLTMTLERVLSTFFKEHPNSELDHE